MKILHIFDHSIPLHSGYTFRSMSILKEQQKLGWETFHITGPKQGECKEKKETVDGLLFYRSEELTGWRNNIPILNQWMVVHNLKKRLKEIIREIKPDILHAHSPALNGLAALSAGKLFNIPVVYEIRAFWEDAAVDHGTSKENGLRYRVTRALETFVIKNADAVTTICEGLKNDIVNRSIPEEKITVIPNAVNIDTFSIVNKKNSKLEKKYNLTECKVLGFIGSFYAYEGLLNLLKAFSLMDNNSDFNNIKVLLVGGGFEEKKLKSYVKKFGLEEKVIFTGRVPHHEVQNYYSLIDILIYPRLSMRLTELVTPLKPLEAMAQKQLFVASDVGGHKELIQDGVNGFLYKHDRIDELAELLSTMLSNLNSYEEIKNNGRDYVEKERNWKVSVSNYQSIYNKLLKINEL